MVGSDHFHQLSLDNVPQFLVGGAFFDADSYNEEHSSACPVRAGARGALHAHSAGRPDHRFDLAFSHGLRGRPLVTCPIVTLRPQADLPVVPVYTNIFAPPMPRPERFVALGRTLRQLVESWPADKRVAIIGTGHLSLELGGPRQFGPHGPDPEFDRTAVEWIANGDVEGCLAEVTLDSLHAPGNATHGFMDFMLMMGAAGDGVKADYVDSLDLFHTMEAYFTWYPEGAPPRKERSHERVPARRVPFPSTTIPSWWSDTGTTRPGRWTGGNGRGPTPCSSPCSNATTGRWNTSSPTRAPWTTFACPTPTSPPEVAGGA